MIGSEALAACAGAVGTVSSVPARTLVASAATAGRRVTRWASV